MNDNLLKKYPHDSSKVNVNEDWEIKYWCDKWKVSPLQLRNAVKSVGTSVNAVAKFLGK